MNSYFIDTVGFISDIPTELIGKKHALKKYDQFTLNTSCFSESNRSNSITTVMQFHKNFVLAKIMNKSTAKISCNEIGI